MNFINWLLKQKDRDDIVGDLAKDCITDIKFYGGEFNSYDELKERIENKGGDSDVMYALKEAYKEQINNKYR